MARSAETPGLPPRKPALWVTLTVDSPEPPCQSIVLFVNPPKHWSQLTLQRNGRGWFTPGQPTVVFWGDIVDHLSAGYSGTFTLIYEGTCPVDHEH